MRTQLLLTVFTLAFAVGVALPGSAAAGPLPPSWSYRWQLGPVFGDSPGSGHFTYSVSGTPGTYGTDFGFPNGPQPQQGSHATLAAAVDPWAYVNLPDVATFSGQYGQPYDLGLAVRDGASGQTGVFHFAGEIDGEVNFTRVTLTNAVNGPATQTMRIGSSAYTVAFGMFDSPTGPLAFNSPGGGFAHPGSAGELRAEVTVVAGTPAATPEPTTLVLAAIGAGVAFGFRSLRRRVAGSATA